jgi:hypothetical protein
MSDLSAPDCKIFLDAEMSEREVISVVMQGLFPPGISDSGRCEVEILKNEDYDSSRRRAFPDGFVYFRYYLDLYMAEVATEEKAALVTRLLAYLWDDWGVPAVAACAFEQLLPEHGGYRSPHIPWPQ